MQEEALLEAPVLGLAVPAGQGVAAAPPGQVDPGGQGWQEVAPGAGEVVPGGHGVQVEAPALEKDPVAQSVALAEEGGQAEPAGQTRQHALALYGAQFHAEVA